MLLGIQTPDHANTLLANAMSIAVTEYGTHNLGLFTLPPPNPEWEKKHGAPDLE